MGMYEDEDGIDGPAEKAWARAMAEDEEERRRRKVKCTAEEYRGAIYEASGDESGGVGSLIPLSTYTYIDDPGTTPMGPGTHVYTEWGTKDGVFVAECERHNDEVTYRIPAERVSPRVPPK